MNKAKTPKYSPEVRERAVRMVQEHRGEYSSTWAAVESIAPKIGCSPHTLHEWVKRHEVDAGLRDGVASEERERIKALVSPASNMAPPKVGVMAPFQSAQIGVSNRVKIGRFSGVSQRPFWGSPGGVLERDNSLLQG